MTDSAEWLAQPGTVGRPLDGCNVKIVLPDGNEAAVGTPGEIYLDPGPVWPGFTYAGNRTARTKVERDGFVTVGDGGWVGSRKLSPGPHRAKP